jgi:hypothetical protein
MTTRSVNEASIVALRDNALAMLKRGVWHNVGLTTLDKTRLAPGETSGAAAKDTRRQCLGHHQTLSRIGGPKRRPFFWNERTMGAVVCMAVIVSKEARLN